MVVLHLTFRPKFKLLIRLGAFVWMWTAGRVTSLPAAVVWSTDRGVSNVAYFPETVAKKFLELAQQEGRQLDPLKLIKLVYFAHGAYLAVLNQPLLNESIEAWKYGPVVASLYHRFKKYGRDPIPAEECNSIPGTVPSSDTEATRAIEATWKVFKNSTGAQLSSKTHAIGTPWDRVWKEAEGILSYVIPDSIIREFFTSDNRGKD